MATDCIMAAKRTAVWLDADATPASFSAFSRASWCLKQLGSLSHPQ